MAASSPYSQNDYISNFRPYQLPVNDRFKAFVAQDQFWKEGAQRVKSVYDEALNLKLSLEPNKEIRRKFLEESESQLAKLSGKNLADPSVQQQGFGIFKELFKDEGILYDDAMTRHYEKVRQDALSFREDGDGKQYSDTNLSYALDGYNEFVNSKDRMAGKKFYQKRKEYTPFYDPTTELNNILKNCKPDSASNDVVQGYRVNTYSNESLTSAKVNTCLDGGLSDRAKRQLQINGYTTYKNNPEALRDKYIPHLNGTASQLAEETAAIKGVLANKDTLKNLKKEDLNKLGIADISQITPDLIKNLENQVQLNESRIFNIRNSVGKMISGDLSDITGDNYESIAGAVYSRDYMQNVAEGFSYNFTKNSMKADPLQMMFYQQAQQNARQEDQQQFELDKMDQKLQDDLQLKQLELMGKSGNIKGLAGLFGGTGAQGVIDDARIYGDTKSPFTEIDKADSYDMVTAKRQDIVNERTGINQQLIKNLKRYGLDSDVQTTSDPRFSQFFNNFQLTASGDPEKLKTVNQYHQNMGRLVFFEDMLRNTQETVDRELKPTEEKIKLDLSKKPVINLAGVTISQNEILNFVMGKQSSISSRPGAMYYPPNASKPVQLTDYYINGKKISEEEYVNSGFQNALTNIKNKVGVDIKKKRNEIMQQETVLQKEGYLLPFLNVNDPEGTGFKNRVAQYLGLGNEYLDKIQIGALDLAGRVIVTMKDAKKNETDYDKEAALDKLKRYGGRENKVSPDDENAIVLEGINELTVIDEKNTASFIEPYIRSLEKNTTSTQDKSTGFTRSLINNRSYRLDISKNYDGSFEYRIIDSEKASPVFSSSDRKRAVGTFTELTQKKLEDIAIPQ